jgi:mannose-1-phosphate guanylyltransferase
MYQDLLTVLQEALYVINENYIDMQSDQTNYEMYIETVQERFEEIKLLLEQFNFFGNDELKEKIFKTLARFFIKPTSSSTSSAIFYMCENELNEHKNEILTDHIINDTRAYNAVIWDYYWDLY